MPWGGHWIVLCAGIAAAGGNCVDAAAWSVVAGIGSSKRMEGVSAVSANSPRYRGCCGCRARRAAPAQVPAVRRCRNLHWWRRVEASSANPKPKSSLHKIGPLLHVATPVAKSNMDIAYSEPKYGSGTYILLSPLCQCGEQPTLPIPSFPQ